MLFTTLFSYNSRYIERKLLKNGGKPSWVGLCAELIA